MNQPMYCTICGGANHRASHCPWGVRLAGR
ncbi:hypothetical protein ACUXAV_005089 [Cupriavidus metallidurans]